METKTINLRGLPVDLVRRAKAYAALRGMTLKDFVIEVVSEALENEIPAIRSTASSYGAVKREKRREKSKK